MTWNFEALIAPLSREEFSAILHARTLRFVPGNGSNRFETLLSIDALFALLDGGTYPVSKLRVTHRERVLSPLLYMDNGKLSGLKLRPLLRHEASLILEPLDRYLPHLGALRDDIRRDLNEYIKIGAILTSGGGGALRRHFDPEDLIVVQIEGSKRWQVYGPPAPHPLRHMSERAAPDTAPVFDRVLEPGDLLFLPAGYWHHCENGAGQSLHIGIFIKPPTAWHAMQSLIDALADEEIFRMPLSRYRSDAERTVHESQIRARLAEKIQAMSLLPDVPPAESGQTMLDLADAGAAAPED